MRKCLCVCVCVCVWKEGGGGHDLNDELRKHIQSWGVLPDKFEKFRRFKIATEAILGLNCLNLPILVVHTS